jgi:uncharacterized caspase-like protein
MVTLWSCPERQSSYEREDVDHGAFTYFLLEGLKGGADGSNETGVKDGVVTTTELAQYASTQTAEWAKKKPLVARDVSAVLSFSFSQERI